MLFSMNCVFRGRHAWLEHQIFPREPKSPKAVISKLALDQVLPSLFPGSPTLPLQLHSHVPAYVMPHHASPPRLRCVTLALTVLSLYCR